MNPAEECLRCLQSQNWTRISTILSNDNSARDLLESPTFAIFENIFIDELKRYESDSNEDLIAVAARIFQIHEHKKSIFTLSENSTVKIAKYLFDKQPHETFAKHLTDDPDAKRFLENQNREIQSKIDTSLISANLNIKVGKHGELVFDKEIFNSPQERELFLAAKKILPDYILLPNTALSTIIDSKICEFLDDSTKSFFFKSTLDLCVVNPTSYKPELFIELDSSWHDTSKNQENDKKKDDIFKKAGLVLNRLRKKGNKDMTEIFSLFINQHYVS